MINRYEFQQAAEKFSAGKLSLQDFTNEVFSRRQAAVPRTSLTEHSHQLPRLPARLVDSHKGTYGRIIVVGGSLGMAGAPSLSALAALRSGAGVVTVATPRVCQPTVAGYHPAFMTIGLPDDSDGKLDRSAEHQLGTLCHDAACVAIGPGLGISESLQTLLRDFCSTARCPLVIDADGLNNLGTQLDFLDSPFERVLTPHPGELKRLLGIQLANQERVTLENRAQQLAASTSTIVVLKGAPTLITDGKRHVHNGTGNAGMATAGSGDVLTGVIAALMGQGLPGFDAAVLGCHLHGLSGDLAEKKTGQHAMIASDLIDYLPPAFLSIS